MENSSTKSSVMELFRGLTEVLTTPVTITGRPLSTPEMRRRRAERTRRKLLNHPIPFSTPLNEKGKRFSLHGTVSEGGSTPFAINGQDFVVDNNTWLVGDLVTEVYAVVNGIIAEDGKKYARTLVVENPVSGRLRFQMLKW